MNSPAQNEPQSQLATTVQAIVESENSLVGILSKAAEDLFKIQTSAIASGMNENLTALTPTPMPQNPVFLLWQVPSLMQQKAKRRLGHWQDSLSILAQSQQQMMAWASQSLLGNVAQTSASLSKFNAVFFSRRQTAEVINFPDRRLDSASAEPSSLAVRRTDAQRMVRQAA